MLDMHLDTLVRRIKGLTDEQKTMVSLIVAEASDKKMAGYLGVSAADCPAKVAALLTDKVLECKKQSLCANRPQ